MSTSLLCRLSFLLAVLRHFQTAEGRKLLRAKLRRRSRRGLPQGLRGIGARLSGTSHHMTSPTGTEATRPVSWRPRDMAERMARRARLGSRAGEGSPSGGRAVLDRYGSAFYSAIGARGGSTVLEERGVDYMQDIGARGGAATRQRYGREHYAEIGRKGGQAGRGRKGPRKRPGQLALPIEPTNQ